MSLVLDTDVSRGPTQTCIYEQNCTQQIKDRALIFMPQAEKLGLGNWESMCTLGSLACYSWTATLALRSIEE